MGKNTHTHVFSPQERMWRRCLASHVRYQVERGWFRRLRRLEWLRNNHYHNHHHHHHNGIVWRDM